MNPTNLTNEDLIELTNEIKNYWEIDPVNKVIQRKRQSILFRFLALIGVKRSKYPLQVLYRFTKESFFTEQFIVYEFPFDNPEISGIYKMANNYRIPIKDRKYLTHGPLYHQDGATILIPEKTMFFLDKKWVRLTITSLILINVIIALATKVYGVFE